MGRIAPRCHPNCRPRRDCLSLRDKGRGPRVHRPPHGRSGSAAASAASHPPAALCIRKRPIFLPPRKRGAFMLPGYYSAGKTILQPLFPIFFPRIQKIHAVFSGTPREKLTFRTASCKMRRHEKQYLRWTRPGAPHGIIQGGYYGRFSQSGIHPLRTGRRHLL